MRWSCQAGWKCQEVDYRQPWRATSRPGYEPRTTAAEALLQPDAFWPSGPRSVLLAQCQLHSQKANPDSCCVLSPPPGHAQNPIRGGLLCLRPGPFPPGHLVGAACVSSWGPGRCVLPRWGSGHLGIAYAVAALGAFFFFAKLSNYACAAAISTVCSRLYIHVQ